MTSNSPSTMHGSEDSELRPGNIVNERDSDVDHDNKLSSEDPNTDAKVEESLSPEEKLPVGPLTDQERNLLFEKGIKFKKKGNTQHALHCLLACVRDLKGGSTFQMLPECLHNIAEIYSQLEDYENAVSFVQAEKLYYETFLINVSNEAQKERGVGEEANGPTRAASSNEVTAGMAPKTDGVNDPQETSAEARSANEYENLAHMCLKKKNAQLALEYCGKAVKLRQSIYGEQHPVTKKTLDLFTVIYAEMGKEQYSAAMQKFNDAKQSVQAEQREQPPENAASGKENMEVNRDLPADPTQSPTADTTQEERDSATPATPDSHATLSVTPGQAMLLFFLLTAAVTIGVTLFCCYVSGTDPASTYRYIVTRLKFYYYYYFRRAPGSDKFF